MLGQTSNTQNKSFLPVETCFLCLRVLKYAKAAEGHPDSKIDNSPPDHYLLFGLWAPIMHTSILIIKKNVPPIEINKKMHPSAPIFQHHAVK